MKSFGNASIGTVRFGVLFNAASFWVGAHWSRYNRRLCVNILPTLTIWVSLPGGIVPSKDKA